MTFISYLHQHIGISHYFNFLLVFLSSYSSTMNFLQFLVLSLCIFDSNSLKEIDNEFLDIYHLDDLASQISNMFSGIGFTGSIFPRNYGRKMAHAMSRIMYQLAFYDQPSLNLDFLDSYSHENKVFGNWEDLKIVIHQVVEYIDYEYGRFKKTAKALKAADADLKLTKPSTYQDLTKTNDNLQDIVTFDDPNDNTTFLPQVFDRMEKARKIRCDDHIPPMQFVMFQIYHFLITSQLKAFAVYVLDSQYEFLIDASLSVIDLEYKIYTKLIEVKSALLKISSIMKTWVAFANQEIKNCLPEELIRDKNFIELERVFQLIVIPEYGFSSGSSCLGSCGDVRGHTFGQKHCYNDYCASCEGVLSDCQNKLDISYCSPSEHSSRRYEWVETEIETSRLRGTGIESDPRLNWIYCADGDLRVLSSNKTGYGARGFCDYCICTCEENTHYSTKSTFVLSSRIVQSDIEKNKVITGVRFVKKDRIIYTQIKQGQLMRGGRIDQNTNHWKMIEPLERDEVNAQIQEKIKFHNRTVYENFIVIGSEINNINLNDLYCPWYGYVLTGVGLRMSETPENENQISLFIDCHPVDFKKARIFTSDGTGPIEDSRPHGIKVEIGGLPPDRVHDNYNRDLVDGYYVKFEMSDIIKDGGQTVIPWFDAQDVTSDPGIPLSGIGLHFKGGNDSGGFLQYQLHSINYFNFM